MKFILGCVIVPMTQVADDALWVGVEFRTYKSPDSRSIWGLFKLRYGTRTVV